MGREFLRPHRIYLSLRNVSFNLFSRHDDVQSSRPGGSIVQRAAERRDGVADQDYHTS